MVMAATLAGVVSSTAETLGGVAKPLVIAIASAVAWVSGRYCSQRGRPCTGRRGAFVLDPKEAAFEASTVRAEESALGIGELDDRRGRAGVGGLGRVSRGGTR